jgi:hypothetical protein
MPAYHPTDKKVCHKPALRQYFATFRDKKVCHKPLPAALLIPGRHRVLRHVVQLLARTQT